MRQRQTLERSVEDFKRLQRDYDDALTLIELGEAESDEASVSEGEAALKRVEEEVLKDHVSHCVEHAITAGDPDEQRQKINELMLVLGKM